MEENLSSSAYLANLLHRLDHSDLVVHQHHTDLIKKSRGNQNLLYVLIASLTKLVSGLRAASNFSMSMRPLHTWGEIRHFPMLNVIFSTWAKQEDRLHQYPRSQEFCSCLAHTYIYVDVQIVKILDYSFALVLSLRCEYVLLLALIESSNTLHCDIVRLCGSTCPDNLLRISSNESSNLRI